MQKLNLVVLAIIILMAWGCKEDEPVVATGFVKGVISNASTGAALGEVRIIVFESDSNNPVQSLSSGPDGTYSAELFPGNYYLKLYRSGFDQVPPKGMSPLPFTVLVGQELQKPFEMNPAAVQDGGIIKGKVSDGAKGVPGVLVVAEKEGKAYSAITDAAGDFYIYNLTAGSYQLKGFVAGYTSEESAVAVESSAETVKNVMLTAGAAGTVSGTISFLASNAREVDVTLVHPLTGEPVPGLLAKTAQNYTITNVPAGTYIARATFRNDERVMDPDWIIKNGEPVVTVGSGSVSRDFSLTGSVKVLAPTNGAETTEPVLITGLTPEFAWSPYSSASDYVVEVSDANGNIIWGGFSKGAAGLEKKVTVPSGQTKVVYNYDQSATGPLVPGKVYRWRVYASKDDNKEATGWKLISVSEDQMGLFRIAE